MVDFKKRLSGGVVENPTDPIKLYETLDRAHDKGPLRPAQEAVLAEWFTTYQAARDVIVKLHTGQGKTLIGLVMLQSRLNAGKGPVLYLCPDLFLIDQACEQAKQFGIKTCVAETDLPNEFLSGKCILVTSVQKLFNGLTKFGLNKQSLPIDTVLMDDAHACSDRIREACRIRIPCDEPAYDAILSLFAADLEQQGAGTYAEITSGKREALLPVPYWAWVQHETEIAAILAKNSERKSIKFAWPLLKDMLTNCQCLFSGAAIEIEPYIAPLHVFGSYSKAKHRIFMSATVTDDSFLIKGLQLAPKTITKPLTYSKETWSGEKMILLPSLMHDDLHREKIVDAFGKSNSKRTYGVVALVPSFARTKDWKAHGASIAESNTVKGVIASLWRGAYSDTVVLVNRYDGIDLPDDTCRVLLFDSKPYSENLVDLYQEQCRPNSESTLMRTVRSVEQGMGRSVRGEKDYSVVIAIGVDLIRLLRDPTSQKYLSSQMATQISIGLEIADMARQEIEEGKSPEEAFQGLIRQCIKRDVEWKAFYVEQMQKVSPVGANEHILKIYAAELQAELKFIDGDHVGASDHIQQLLDGGTIDVDDKAWYLQERARYLFPANRPESQSLQVTAHRKNRLLLRPPKGVVVAKLTVVSQGRAEAIASWVARFAAYSDLEATVSDILGRLTFGTKSEKFEGALNELGKALGFAAERPDAEWKEGPDNLWAIDASQYLLLECKSEVDVNRMEVNKREAEQMNRSCAWFDKHYPGMKVQNIIIHPAAKIESAAAFTHKVEGMRQSDLNRFCKACRSFFKAFASQNLKDLSATNVQKQLNAHALSAADILTQYSKKLKDLK